MKIQYLRKNDCGEMIPCTAKEATHVRLPKSIYDSLADGSFGFVNSKINLIRRERTVFQHAADLAASTNDNFNECREYATEEEMTISKCADDMLYEMGLCERR